jgi:hypothetical protein
MLPPNAPGFVKDMAVLELNGQFEMEGVKSLFPVNRKMLFL